jgi:hypothetical protein
MRFPGLTKHSTFRTLVVTAVFVLPLGLFLLHAPIAQPTCHEMQHGNQADVCPCGVVSLHALRLISGPWLQGRLSFHVSTTLYLVFLGQPDPPPRSLSVA